MTYQTTEPIEHRSLNPTARSLWGQVRLLDKGELTLDAPYQRQSVWSDEQRIMLIKSIVSGVPIPALIINEREAAELGEPYYAVVDGKQRMLTVAAWLHDELAVPASWWPPEDVVRTENTPDGPYVRYTGLSLPRQRWFKNIATIAVITARVETIQEEAELFLLVNSAGTGQTVGDLDRARRVAGRPTETASGEPGPKERIRAFLEARREVSSARRGGLDKDIIYAAGTSGSDEPVELRASDLEALLCERDA